MEIKLNKYVRCDLLYEQITAAFPTLHVGVDVELLGRQEDNKWAQILVVPDNVDQIKLQALITAHNADAPTQSDQFRSQIVTMAQSAVGVTLQNLTAAQIKALMAVMLFKMGGVDPKTLQVLPLSQWV